MSATIFNTDNLSCQGFVYKWTYIPTGQYYIGIRKGTPEGKYIGSGKRFLNKWNATERSDWQREILYNGEYEQCPAIEEQLVSDETLRDPLCLNLVQGGRGWRPHRNFSRKGSCYRVKPQAVVINGFEYPTRMQACKVLRIEFSELDALLRQAYNSSSYNDYNRA